MRGDTATPMRVQVEKFLAMEDGRDAEVLLGLPTLQA
jgi:hypothetical protein